VKELKCALVKAAPANREVHKIQIRADRKWLLEVMTQTDHFSKKYFLCKAVFTLAKVTQ